MNSTSSRSFARQIALGAFCFVAGAGLFARAHGDDTQVAVQRAGEALHRDGRGGSGRGEGIFSSPDGNFAVVDLGEGDYYGNKTRSHAVYDFAGKKVYIVRFRPSTNSVDVTSETLR